MITRYRDRTEAGRVLATELMEYANRPDVLVLALPRGGVVVGFEVAKALHAPLDVFVVRKLGVPGHEELAMGAIATGGVCVLNDEVVRMLHIPEEAIKAVTEREQRELERREHLYRDGRPAPDVKGRIVFLVDDGLATGATMRAAIAALHGVGYWYDDFSQTTDEEVHDLLGRSLHEQTTMSNEQQTEHQGM
jgi:predicted phosphoribosyltransferase